jgi:hypothetical protein
MPAIGGSAVYPGDMAGSVYVEVPPDLAERLVDDGFRRAGVKRGAGLAETAQAGIEVGANLVTILLAQYQIPEFLQHLRAFVRGRREQRHSAKLVIEVDGRRMAISLEGERDEAGDIPVALMRGMAALLSSLTDPEGGA